ncbi:MAG: hypothetical protein ACTS5P_02155 [Candidatus Hodgkinia cicadicola]
MLNIINLRSCFKRICRPAQQVLTFVHHCSLSSSSFRSFESISTKLAKLSNLTFNRFPSNTAQFTQNKNQNQPICAFSTKLISSPWISSV